MKKFEVILTYAVGTPNPGSDIYPPYRAYANSLAELATRLENVGATIRTITDVTPVYALAQYAFMPDASLPKGAVSDVELPKGVVPEYVWAYVQPIRESKEENRQILQAAFVAGYEWCARTGTTFRLFKTENELMSFVSGQKVTPVHGKLRVGNGDNLCWYL
jgi:hypothetical protein